MTSENDELDEQVIRLDRNAEKNQDEKVKERIADKLIRITISESAGDDGPESVGGLFHTPDSTAYIDINVRGRRETWPVRSKAFRHWLMRVYYEICGSAPNSEALQQAIGMAEARAIIDGPEREVFIRVAAHNGKLYLDLANAKWEAVELDVNGWRVIGSPPVRFRRAAGMRPLPTPRRGGHIEQLRPFQSAV
jgi:hypothetical protein